MTKLLTILIITVIFYILYKFILGIVHQIAKEKAMIRIKIIDEELIDWRSHLGANLKKVDRERVETRIKEYEVEKEQLLKELI